MPSFAPFGAQLRRYRQNRGMSQNDLALAAGCEREAIQQFEAASKRPSSQLVDVLARVLDLRSDERSSFIDAARAVQLPGLRRRRAPAASASLPPFPSTKLQPPRPRGDLLLRPHLSVELAEAVGRARLVLVSALPGAGKTTLLAQALGPFLTSGQAVWLTLDEDDNDLARFLAALSAACTQLTPAAAHGQALLAASGQGRVVEGGLGRHVVGALASAMLTLEQPAALILDDLHTISTPEAYSALDYLIEQLPPQLTVVLASRHDPPLGLARHRARRELVELRMERLRFTEAEAGALLNGQLGLGLSELAIAGLHAQTEGWVAGLGLLAASLERIGGAAERARFLDGLSRSDRYLFEYLAEEVLNRQDPFVRMFLLETAILQDLTPAVCAAVTGRGDAGAVLDELYRRNLFLVAIGAEPEGPGATAEEAQATYRYHTLFRDFLRERLRREAPEWLQSLHRRAAQAELHPSRRIHHALAGTSWEQAASLIAETAEPYAEQGATATLLGWISALPEPVRHGDPWMRYWQGVCAWKALDFQAAQDLFALALEGFELRGDIRGQSETLVQLLGPAAAWADLSAAEARAEQALAGPLPNHRRARLLVARAQGRVTHGRWQEANADLDAALQLAGASADQRVPIDVAEGFRGIFSVLPGGVDRFERLVRLLRPHAQAPESLPRLDLLELQMYTCLWRGRWDDTAAAGEALNAIGERLGLAGWARISSTFILAICAVVQGDQASIARWMPLLLPPPGEDPSVYNASLNATFLFCYGRGHWLLGRSQELATALEMLRSIAARSSAEWLQVLYGMLRALALLDEGRAGEAEPLLRRAVDHQDRTHFTRLFGSARLLLAHLHLSAGRNDAAIQMAEPILDLSARQDTPGFLLWEGQRVVSPLLRLALERGVHTGLAERTLLLFGEEGAAAPQATPASLFVPATGESLTAREVEVLVLMARGASNQAIADQLIISLHTAKRHVANILQKLGAASRTEAVARARDMGMV